MKRTLFALLCLAVTSLQAADLEEARRLIQDKRVPEAKPLLEQALAKDPNNVEALGMLGSCQMQMMDYAGATVTLERATELNPRDAKLQTMLGSTLLMEAGRKSSISYARKGRNALDKALELAPSDIAVLDACISFYASAPWVAGGDKDKAMELVERLRKLDPAKAFSVEVGLLAKDKKFDEAFKLCDARLKELPSDYMALYEFGRICGMASRRQTEGILTLEKCLEMTPPAFAPGHDGAQFRLGVLHKQLAHVGEANKAFDEALKLAAGNPDMIRRVQKAR